MNGSKDWYLNGSKDWYLSRGVWGSVATLLVGVVGLFHLHADAQWTSDLVNWLVTLGSLIGGAISLWGRLRATKQIAAGSTASVTAKLVLLALLMAAMGFLGGCQNSAGTATTQPAALDETQVLTAANQSVALAQTILADLHAAGVFSPGDWQNIVNGEQAAAAALDAWQANLGQPGAVQAQAAFEAALPNLLSYVKLGNARKSPATQPVG